MAIIKINDEKEFQKHVLDTDGRVMVDFYADWCGPCKMMAEVVEKISVENPELKICKVNIDENRDMASEYNVMSIPTIILFEKGNAVKKSVGSKTKARLLAELEYK